MPTELKMPQLGESVHEGTISRWLKQPGEHVEKYEPLLEVATDKVESEVTAPEGGIVQQILVPEGETVKVGTLLAVIVGDGDSTQALTPPLSQSVKVESSAQMASPASSPLRVSPLAARIAQDEGVSLEAVTGSGPGGQVTKEDVLRVVRERGNGEISTQADKEAGLPTGEETGRYIEGGARPAADFLSPRVQLLAGQLGVDLTQVSGTGKDGRITARDVEEYAARQAQMPALRSSPPSPLPPRGEGSSTPATPPRPSSQPRLPDGEGHPKPSQDLALGPASQTQAPSQPLELMPGDELTPLSTMRRIIAERMVHSKHTAPHVTTVHEADVTRMVKFFNDNFDRFRQREGFNLTYTPFFIQAVVNALKAFPQINVSFTAQGIIQRKALNIGMAVALADGGLIVPVIKAADEKTLTRLARDVVDLATRARAKKLTATETRDGTFTISNYGVFGGLLGTPVINQPEAAILGVGAVKKRPVVVESELGDTIAIRSMVYLALSFDHRAFDGGAADQFMQRVVRELEQGPWSL